MASSRAKWAGADRGLDLCEWVGLRVFGTHHERGWGPPEGLEHQAKWLLELEDERVVVERVETLTRSIRTLPVVARAAQRRRDATQSRAVIAVPSCQPRPPRSLKRQVSPSSSRSYFSTICRWTRYSRSGANSVS